MNNHQPHAGKKKPVLVRRPDGELCMTGVGTVILQIDYEHVLGRGGQGIVFGGKIFKLSSAAAAGESLVMQVCTCGVCST